MVFRASRKEIGKGSMMAVLIAVLSLLVTVVSAGLNEDLIRAVASGDLPGVKLLLAAGAEVNVKSTDGFTALSTATAEDHQEIRELLLTAGAK